MSEEVTIEEQAAMSLILSDKVREIVREEIKAALEDANFLLAAGTTWFPLAERIFDALRANDMLRQYIKNISKVL